MIVLLLLLSPVLSSGQKVCLPQPVDRTAAQIVSKQPLYYNLVPRYAEPSFLDTSNVDNICTNYFPLTDCYDKLFVFHSLVYRNGTNVVYSYLVGANTTGIFYYTSPVRQNFERIIFACDSTTDYGFHYFDDLYPGYVIGLTPYWRQYPSQYQSILNQFGYDSRQYRVLPMNLPSQCVTYLICSNNAQGCQTNNCQTRNCQTT